MTIKNILIIKKNNKRNEDNCERRRGAKGNTTNIIMVNGTSTFAEMCDWLVAFYENGLLLDSHSPEGRISYARIFISVPDVLYIDTLYNIMVIFYTISIFLYFSISNPVLIDFDFDQYDFDWY